MSKERESLREIEFRHGRDKWKDAGFIGVAILLTILSLGALSTKAMGKLPSNSWAIMLPPSRTAPDAGVDASMP